MSPPNRQSTPRRGFLAARAATTAAVSALALSARGADAASGSAASTGGPLGATAHAVSQRAGDAAHTIGEDTMLDQMTTAQAQAAAIRPFVVDVPDAKLDDLRRRIAATQWPERETVGDSSQGVPLATMQQLAQYWATDYDWRKVEARLSALPNFVTEIDGLDIHFIHVRSRHENALPLLVSHGWPGSIIEQLKIIDPLTNPTAYGASASDAFDVVIPSMPGYGFSGKPTSPGWGPERMARAWDVLMTRLGYSRYVAQGGDWGAFVVDQMGLQAPAGFLALHTNLPATAPARLDPAPTCGAPT